MGVLVDGKWTERGFPTDEAGRFVRAPTTKRGQIRADGSTPFPAEAGRYHLYVAWACPWAHRTLIMRRLKRLEDAITVNIVDTLMTADGWHFGDDPVCTKDEINGAAFLRDVYVAADPKFTGRVTVPVLWDKKSATIVNNESREIIRMFDCEMNAVGDASVDLYPEPLRAKIDETIDAIYEPINNGVYRSGFARSQSAYEEAVTEVFGALERWEAVLADQRYLCGGELTEADLCMYTTLVRFDPVYHYHFKCNLKRIADFPHLTGYLRDLYQRPAFRETTNFDQIKQHYFRSHESVNPSRVVPLGPAIDLDRPHGRDRFA